MCFKDDPKKFWGGKGEVISAIVGHGGEFNFVTRGKVAGSREGLKAERGFSIATWERGKMKRPLNP